MAYAKNQLISRRGYSGMGGILDTIGNAAGSALKFYNQEQQAAGAAAANRDLTTALLAQQNGGIGMGTILLLGGLGVGAYFLIRKKKAS